MGSPAKWQILLAPWAERHGQMLSDLAAYCGESTDEELQEILDATLRPNQTNCWWVTFEVAKIVRDAAQRERIRRERARAAS